MRTGIALAMAGSLFCSRSEAYGQEEPANVGHLRVVNTIALETPTMVQVGSIKMMGGRGMPAGSTSGIMTLYARSYTIAVENALCTPPSISKSIEIEAGKTFAAILYTDIRVADDGTVEHEPKILELKKQVENKDPTLVLVSMSNRETVDVTLRGKVVTLRAKQPKEVAVKLDETVGIKSGDVELEALEILSPINYIVFLFDEPGGKGLQSVVLQHKKVVYDPPQESFDD
ncbi:MAG: hypothetical protein AAF591_21985 [Verrucomicrobiota bacterium]